MTENERRAKWAGFKKSSLFVEQWIYPDVKESGKLDELYDDVPNFTDPELGIAHCFKWLVPKFHAWTMGSTPGGAICAVVVLKKDIRGEACANDAATALCNALDKAIDKLIDSEVKP